MGRSWWELQELIKDSKAVFNYLLSWVGWRSVFQQRVKGRRQRPSSNCPSWSSLMLSSSCTLLCNIISLSLHLYPLTCQIILNLPDFIMLVTYGCWPITYTSSCWKILSLPLLLMLLLLMLLLTIQLHLDLCICVGGLEYYIWLCHKWCLRRIWCCE